MFINSVEVFLKTKYNFALRKDIKVWFFLHELDAFDALIRAGKKYPSGTY